MYNQDFCTPYFLLQRYQFLSYDKSTFSLSPSPVPQTTSPWCVELCLERVWLHVDSLLAPGYALTTPLSLNFSCLLQKDYI